MENPRNVIGTSRQSYYNDQNSMDGNVMGVASNASFQGNDLYEYEETTTKKVINNAKQFIGSINGNSNAKDDHSPNQYNRGVIDSLCVQINQTLLIPKLFYFFFFAAFGSLFPLMAIYFKQMAMSPYQVGILFGFKPFVEFFSVPFWANMSERYRKGKLVLMISLTCWILFTVGVGLIKPPVKYCLMHNETNIFLDNVKSDSKPSETLPKNIIVSGGSSVISKRSIDYNYFNEYDSFLQKNPKDTDSFNKNYQDSNLNIESIGLIIKKRADIDEEDVSSEKQKPHFKVINVTKIIRRTKKTTTTTSSSTTIQLDELEFKANNVKGKLITKSTKSSSSLSEKTTKKSKIAEAIDQVENNLVKESQLKENKNENKQKSDDVDAVSESINSSINDLINKTIGSNKSDEDSKEEKESKLETKTTISKIGRKKEKTSATTREVSTLKTEAIPTSPKVEKSHYFHPTALETKNKKIILLNHSVYDLVKPNLLTSVVYIRSDVHKIFIVFLVFILVGEFFSAPAITLADTCTLQCLGPARADLYGRQRMFGSLGWGIAMFIVGLLLDRSKAFTDHPCGIAGPDERNYTVCFAIFSVLMGGALIIATQMNFNYGDNEEIPLKSIVKTQFNKARGVQNSQFDRKILVNEGDDGDEFTSQYGGASDEYSNQNTQTRGGVGGFNEIGVEESSKQRYFRLLKLCMSVKHASFLFMVWFMGIGVGLVFTFLFWHLQDLGGSPALYGIASVINHVSELVAYYFVDKIVVKFGHIKIFYAALLGNAIRFVYVSLLSQPYWILPFEFIQALLWATATSYFAQSVPDDLRSTAQGILQSVHFGLGRGCGSVIGGILITIFETKITFGVYGILSLFCMFIMIAINLWSSDIEAKQAPLYGQNQMVNEDDYNNFNSNKDQIPEINNAVNPRMMDTNFYYQPTNTNDKGKSAKSTVPMVPHGVPGGAVNWSK